MTRQEAKNIAIERARIIERISIVTMPDGTSFALVSSPVRAKTTKLRARWTVETEHYLNDLHRG